MLLLTLLFGCPKISGSKSHLPTIIASMQSAAEISLVLAEDSKELRKRDECIIGYSISSALLIGIEALQGNTNESGKLPAITVDVSDCLSIGSQIDADLEEEFDRQVRDISLTINAILSTTYAMLLSNKDKMNCKEYLWASAALEYSGNLSKEVLDEWSQPDGKVDVESITINLECKD